jgi:O-antigen/teichoic acid export membrane protein
VGEFFAGPQNATLHGGEKSPPSEVREVRLVAAGAWSIGGRAMLLVGNVIAAPFTIRLLGPSGYGIWSILQMVLGFAYYADAGMGAASTQIGARAFANQDNEGEATVVWSALCVTAGITTLIATGLGAIAPLLLASLLHLHGKPLHTAVMALRIISAVFLLQAFGGVLNTPSLLRLQFRRYTLITSLTNLAAIAGVPVAIKLAGGGVLTAAIIVFVTSVAMVASLLWLAVSLQPCMRRPQLDREVMRRLLAYGGAATAAGLATIPLDSAPNVLLAASRNTVSVAYYSVASRLATTLQTLPEQVSAPLMPALATLSAAGRREDLRSLYSKALAGLFLAVTPMAIVLATVAQPFLSIWAGPLYGTHSAGPFFVALIGVWLNCFGWVPVAFLQASGLPKKFAYVEIAEIPPMLVGTWFLADRLGAIGAATAASARFGLDTIVLLLLVRRIAGLPVLPLSERGWRCLVAPIALAGLSVAIVIMVESAALRMGLVAVLSAAYGIVVWRWVLSENEREKLLAMAMSLLPGTTRLRHSRQARGSE